VFAFVMKPEDMMMWQDKVIRLFCIQVKSRGFRYLLLWYSLY